MRWLILIFYLQFALHIKAQIDISAHNVAVEVNFKNFQANGFVSSPDSSQLSSWNWIVSGFSDNYLYGSDNITGDFARGISNGGESSGGIYAYKDSASDYLMIQPTATDFTPGSLILIFKNNTSGIIDHLRIDSRISVFNDENRKNNISLYYSADSINYFLLDSASSAGNASGMIDILIDSIFDIENIFIPQSSNFYLKWEGGDISGAGSRDEFLIDMIRIESVFPVDSCLRPQDIVIEITAKDQTTSSITFKFKKANTASSTLVIMTEDSMVTDFPQDQSEYYKGDTIGSSKVVYSGKGDEFTVDSLTAGKVMYYHFVSVQDSFCLDGPLYKLDSIIHYKAAPLPLKIDFRIICITDTSIIFQIISTPDHSDGILIVGREGDLPPHSVNSLNLGNILYSSNFYSAPEFGSTYPKSKVLFSGLPALINIRGLLKDSTYSFRLYGYANGLFSDPVTTVQSPGISEVEDLVILAQNNSVIISWTNPDLDCFDEVLILASGDSVSTSPVVGGFANDTFGLGFSPGDSNYIVYSDNESDIKVSGLKNGKRYYFKVFLRAGSDWSKGKELTAIPHKISNLEEGDLLVVSVNTNYPMNGYDEICLLSLNQILPGTAIDITDNGYERLFKRKWGSTEGFLRLINKTDTIMSGSVICMQRTGDGFSDFQISVGGEVDSNWFVQNLNRNFFFNLNQLDQLWLGQNGVWKFSNKGSHMNTYSGEILYGWTATSWWGETGHETDSYSNGTRVSALYPGMECFNTNVYGTLYPDKVKYTGSLDSCTRRDWIRKINNPLNWTSYSSNLSYDSAGSFDYNSSNIVFKIIDDTVDRGLWIGGSDSIWFNCNNWYGLQIPDQKTDVTLNESSSEKIFVSGKSQNSDRYGDTAFCKDLLVKSNEIRVDADTGITLLVSGSIEINAPGQLIIDSGNFPPSVFIKGNWINNSADPNSFIAGNSNVVLSSDEQLHFVGDSLYAATFNSLVVSSPLVHLHADVMINKKLLFDEGIINTNDHTLFINNPSTRSVWGYEIPNDSGLYENTAYVEGDLKRRIVQDSIYVFPVGALNQGYNPVRIISRDIAGKVNCRFLPSDPGSIKYHGMHFCDSTPVLIDYSDLSGTGYWHLDGDSLNYDIFLHPNILNQNNNPNSDGKYRALKADEVYTGMQWPDSAAVDGDFCSVGDYYNTPGINYSGFSIFSIGGGIGGPALPVQLVSFYLAREDTEVLIRWTTAVEKECNFYSVEKSKDGASFTKIAEIQCKENNEGLNQYLLKDKYPFPGISYYRLIKYDHNNEDKNLGIRSINSDINQTTIYPNPVSGKLFVDSEKITEKINIYDLYGKFIQSYGIEDNIDLNSYPGGNYIVIVHFRTGDVLLKKIVKVR